MSTPDADDVRRYAAQFDLTITDDWAAAVADRIAAQDDRLSTLEDLPTAEPPDRDHWPPTDETDPLGAFLARCEVAGAGEGPLAGLSVGVKDNLAVAGVPMTCGSPLLEGYVPPADATVVTRLLDAGATVVGKTTMDEFALGEDASTMPLRLARNPHDPDRQPGGSSAGSGVAVATGQVDAALGSDTGGSVRYPAAWSGVVGVKPTRGLVPDDGYVQFAETLDAIGVLAGTVADAARVLSVVADGHSDDVLGQAADVEAADAADLAVGVPAELQGRSPELEAVVDAALDGLADRDATVRRVAIPDFAYALPAWLAVARTELGAYVEHRANRFGPERAGPPALTDALDAAFAERPGALGDVVVAALCSAAHLHEAHGDRYYPRAMRARRLVRAGVDEALSGVDVLSSVTVPSLPPRWDEEVVEDLATAVANTAPFNLTGHPAVSLPCGTVAGLPVGLQLVGPRFGEASLLRAASVVEAVLGA